MLLGGTPRSKHAPGAGLGLNCVDAVVLAAKLRRLIVLLKAVVTVSNFHPTAACPGSLPGSLGWTALP